MTTIDKILEAVKTIDVNSIVCEESVKLKLILLVNAVEALAREIRKQRDEIEYLKTLYKHGSKNKDDDNPESGSRAQGNDTKKKSRPALEPRSSSTSTDSTTLKRRTRSELTITRGSRRVFWTHFVSLIWTRSVIELFRRLEVDAFVSPPKHLVFSLLPKLR